MTPDKLRELADEVEALQKPSREMDLRIARALYGEGSTADQRVTESLDAAYSLIPKGWEINGWIVDRITHHGDPILYDIDIILGDTSTIVGIFKRVNGAARTPSIALIAAALRAIAHERETT